MWLKANFQRKCQRLFGIASGILLAIALAALFDGLIAQMRAGSNALDFLPGQAMTISGPAVLKNPIASDLLPRFSPADAPLAFHLDGFFTGYWFGNGMWRGKITANDNAAPGRYDLRIAFRGASAQTTQSYALRVFANAAAQRAASLSLARRWLDLNSFMIAVGAGFLGIVLGLATYWFGRGFGKSLLGLGLAEVYASDPKTASIWCLAPKTLAAGAGNARMVLDPEGRIFGEARAVGWKKGKLQLTLMDDRPPPDGALICLRHPGSAAHN